MATLVVVTAEPRIAPAGLPLTAPVTVAPLEACETPLAALGSSELLWLRRSGETATLVITYSGIERGQLIHVDLASRTVSVPNRPPFGWKLGGER
jgi:hypothetical protein